MGQNGIQLCHLVGQGFSKSVQIENVALLQLLRVAYRLAPVQRYGIAPAQNVRRVCCLGALFKHIKPVAFAFHHRCGEPWQSLRQSAEAVTLCLQTAIDGVRQARLALCHAIRLAHDAQCRSRG